MNIFGLGPTELIIIAVIVLLLFGPKRLPQIGKSLGQTMKAVKDGMDDLEGGSSPEPEKAQPAKPQKAEATPEVVEAEAAPEVVEQPVAEETQEKPVPAES